MSTEALPVPFDAGEYFVGVKDGRPIVEKVGDHEGDCLQVLLFPNPEDASARYYNVRRCRLMVDAEPIRAPESWGSIEGGD